MKFAEMVGIAGQDGVFTSSALLAGQRSPADVRRQIDRWVCAGKVLKLRRKVYVVAEPYAKTSAHPFAVANVLQKTSYVSLQSALAHYGMIPEHVPTTTSVTTRRPETLVTPIGRFSFRHISADLFWGFAEVEVAQGQVAIVASAEKALADLLYLTPGSDDPDYVRELRLARSQRFDAGEFARVVDRMASRKVNRAARYVVRHWSETGEGVLP